MYDWPEPLNRHHDIATAIKCSSLTDLSSFFTLAHGRGMMLNAPFSAITFQFPPSPTDHVQLHPTTQRIKPNGQIFQASLQELLLLHFHLCV